MTNIAILAPFGSFADFYSLSHVVRGQAAACYTFATTEIWAMDSNGEEALEGVPVVGVVPSHDMKPDVIDNAAVSRIAASLLRHIERFKPSLVITHDAVFQASYINIAKAIHDIAKRTPGVKWLHYAHSFVPAASKAALPEWRRTIPKGHKLCYPNTAMRKSLARYYSEDEWNVLACANPHDPRVYGNLSSAVRSIVSSARLFDADVVQTYAFCTTRFEAKGVPYLLSIFRRAVDRNVNAKLVLVNANANGAAANRMAAAVKDSGLGGNVTITGEQHPKGLPHADVLSLLRLSDVFIFPTVAEVDPLVLSEAIHAGCLPCVNAGQVPSLQTCVPGGDAFHLPPLDAQSGFELVSGSRRQVGQAAVSSVLEGVTNWLVNAANTPSIATRRAVMKRSSIERHATFLKMAIDNWSHRITNEQPL